MPRHLHLDDRQAAQVAGPDGDRAGFQEPYSFDGYDLVIMGPGPGNPTEIGQPKIGHLHLAIRSLLSERRRSSPCAEPPVLSLCLGLDLQRRQEPNQGVQKPDRLFGAAERVGFYNTFAARALQDRIEIPRSARSRSAATARPGEVHACAGALRLHAIPPRIGADPRGSAHHRRPAASRAGRAAALSQESPCTICRDRRLRQRTAARQPGGGVLRLRRPQRRAHAAHGAGDEPVGEHLRAPPQQDGDARIRIFTPVNELPFAGHRCWAPPSPWAPRPTRTGCS
ncbi:phenazine biosynthesis protein PhzE [Pseudomonas aeruginosa]|nr:phenazine biosynthesis protein PhzE [Pseudomonas aeruginosa]